MEGAKGHDDDDTVTKELHKYIKRIAELETRVEELTIRAEVYTCVLISVRYTNVAAR